MTEVASEAPDAVLAALDPEQREVALATRGPVCVLAGAGTGKTRAITHRIAYAAAVGHLNPAHVLALTFTVRAAGEMRGRLRQLGAGRVRASTFHAAALRQLNYFWPRVVGGRPPRLVDSKAALVREAAKQAGVRLDGGRGWPTPPPRSSGPRPSRSGRTATRARPGPRAARPRPGRDQVAAVFAGYERLRRERNLIDFESVLELTAAIVLEHRGAADQVRASFRYFVVDEYQDVNPLQKLLLDAWLGDRDELCVVGDPHQVIYSFAGATPGLPDRFRRGVPRRHGGPDGARLPLYAAGGRRGQPAGPGRAPRRGGLEGSSPRASTGRAAAGRAAAGADCVCRRPGRGGRAGRPGPGPAGRGRPGQGDRRPGPGQRRHRAVRAGAGRGRGPVRGARRRAVLRAARGAPGAGPAARRGRGAAPTRGTPCPPRSGTC